jgi:hypothetical protein
MDLFEQAKAVQSHYDLVTFLRALAADAADPTSFWSNDGIDGYLQAVADLAPQIDGRDEKIGAEPPERPTWSLVAELFLVGKYQEG